MNVSVQPLPAVRKRGGPPRWLFAAGAIAVVGAIAGGFVFLQGGNEDAQPPTATPAATAPATPGTPTRVPVAAINVRDRWDYAFSIASNTCAFGAAMGDRYAVSFRFSPATGTSSVISDGDRVKVTAIQDRDIEIGTFTFRFVDFEFTYPVAASGGQRGTATLRTTFSDANTIAASSLTERYDSANCAITGVPAGN